MSRDRLGGDAGARTKRTEAWQSMKLSWTLCCAFTTLHGVLDFCHPTVVNSAKSVSSSSVFPLSPFSLLVNEKFSLAAVPGLLKGRGRPFTLLTWLAHSPLFR